MCRSLPSFQKSVLFFLAVRRKWKGRQGRTRGYHTLPLNIPPLHQSNAHRLLIFLKSFWLPLQVRWLRQQQNLFCWTAPFSLRPPTHQRTQEDFSIFLSVNNIFPAFRSALHIFAFFWKKCCTIGTEGGALQAKYVQTRRRDMCRWDMKPNFFFLWVTYLLSVAPPLFSGHPSFLFPVTCNFQFFFLGTAGTHHE